MLDRDASATTAWYSSESVKKTSQKKLPIPTRITREIVWTGVGRKN
jgi:hypothetical protein